MARRGRRTPGLWVSWAPLVLVLVMPIPAGAFELSGGVSVGVFQAGALPRVAVTPHAGISWRRDSGFLLVVTDLFNILNPHQYGGHRHIQQNLRHGRVWLETSNSSCDEKF